MTDQEAQAAQGSAEVSGVAAVTTDGAYTLFVAEFTDTASAWATYEALLGLEDGRHVAIDGVIVVKRDAGGKLDIQKATDHSTKKGAKYGIVGGVVLGVLFPPSILASAVSVGVFGAALGKVRQLHHRTELADQLADAIAPGNSGIVALVEDPGVVEVRKALAVANRVVESAVDDVAAKDIKAAAKEAEGAEPDAVKA
jgi:uncharacterized membrane protein